MQRDGPRAPELDELGAYAPVAYAALLRAWDAAHEEVDAALLALGRRRVEDQLGLTPDPGPAPREGREHAVAALADQFVNFAPQVTEALLARVRRELGGDGLRPLFDALSVWDQPSRLRGEPRPLRAGAPAREAPPPPRARGPPLAEA